VSCASTTMCVAVPDSGALLVTTDGATWNPPVSTNALALGHVACPSATACYALGANGGVIGTTDGGSHWSSLRPQPTVSTLSAVSCPSDVACFATEATGGRVYKSTDGKRWVQTLSTASEPFSDISCPSASLCLATDPNGSIYKTGDGGQPWPSQALGQPFTSIDCANASSCAAVASNGDSITTPHGGASWAPPVANLTEVSRASCLGWVAGRARSVHFRTTTVGADGSVDAGVAGERVRGVRCRAIVAVAFSAEVDAAVGVARFAGGRDWREL